MKTCIKRTISSFLAICMILGLFIITDNQIYIAAAELKNVSYMSSENFKQGDTVKMTCKATGGTGFYQYAVYFKKTTDTKWTELQKYNANVIVDFKPSEMTDYNVCIKVKDSNGAENKKYFVLKFGITLLNTSSIDKTSIQLGERVNITASAKGGTGKYTYAVFYKKTYDKSWVTKQNFSANSNTSVKPSKAAAYQICVKVKDSSNTITKKYFNINVTQLQNTSVISSSSIKLGNTVKVSCSAKGSSGFYNYAVYYKKESESKWTVKQNFNSNVSVSLKPKYAVKYDICVKVKNDLGNIDKKYFKLSVISENTQTPVNKTPYTITYYIDNNDNYLKKQQIENKNPDIYYSEDGIEFHDLMIDGYRFKGWYTAQTGGTQITGFAKGTTGNKVLYAHWEKVEYTITFDSPDIPVASVKYTVDKGITLTNPSLFGYTFVGWSNDGELISIIPPGTTGNITLHANWTSNRNRAKVVNKLSLPSIIEDMDNGMYLFVYEIGTIENIPLSQIEYIGNTQGININREYEYSTNVSERYAENIAKSISNATVKSSEWTLSEDWNKTTSATNERDEEIGKTHTKTDSENNTDSSKYYISNSSSGATSSSTNEGNSSSYSSKITNSQSTGINGSYTNEHSKDTSVKLTNEIKYSHTENNSDSSTKNTTTDLETEHKDDQTQNHSKEWENYSNQHESSTEKNEDHWNINGNFTFKNDYKVGADFGIKKGISASVNTGPEASLQIGGEYGQNHGKETTSGSEQGKKTSEEYSSSGTVGWRELLKSSTQNETTHSSSVSDHTENNSSTEHSTVERDMTSSTIATSRADSVSRENEGISEQRFDVSKTSSNNWNTEKAYDISSSVSRNAEISETISNVINERYSYTSSNSLGGNNSTTKSTGETQELKNEYASTVEYGATASQTVKKSVSFQSSEAGYYRLVNAGTAHVFAVVGYDIATNSYFTYTYNILDKERHEYLDYSKDNANFNDCENAVLPFEIPYFVNEYIYSVIGRSDGLTVDTETGMITEYNGNAEYVLIPQYVSVQNSNNTNSAVRIRGFDKDTFRGNTNIKGVFMSKYISEIPDHAFDGCTSLEKVIALGISKIGNESFKNCTSLQPFTVDKYIDSLGNNAFKNAFGINVTAKNESVADSAIHSGAKNMFLDISGISGNFNNKKIEISSDTYYFAIVSNDKTYTNLRIDSHATITLISNMILTGNTDTPLKIDSEAVVLSKVKVQDCPGFALILLKPDTDLYLFGTTELSSSGANTLISRNVNFYKLASDVAGTLKVKGKYLLCDKITPPKMLDISNGELVIISEEEFGNMLSSIIVWFDANGGTAGNTNKRCNYGQAYGTLPTPVLNHYSFDGWYTQKSGGNRITENTIVSTLAYQTLYAHWNAKQATVYFDANGGNISTGSKTVTFNSNYGDMPTPTRSNYNFDSWYTAANDGSKVTNNTVVSRSDNHTLYAHWIAKQATVSFNANGGNVSAGSKTVTFNNNYGDMPTPTRSNYNFDGWYTATNDGSKVTNNTVVSRSDNHTLYAHWNAKQATASFNANGGNVSTGSKTVTFNSNYGDMPTPTRSNYDFDGWYTAANGGSKVTNNTVVSCSDNHTLYAHWNAKKFTVTFNANGGSVSYSTKTVQYGCKYGDMPASKRDYYNFVGWFNDNGTKITSESVANTSYNHNLTARWELKGVSGWVKADQVPAGAQITNKKWSYTEKSLKDSRNTAENGYKLASSEWIWCGSGSQNYASFPDGFDKNSWYYQNWNRQPFSAYENATNKRVVNNKWAGFIYWHWMFDCGGANAYDRAIHKRQGYDDTGCYYYRYFGAFDSTQSYTEMGYNLYCNRCGMTTYYNTGRTSYTDSQGSKYWFRFDYYTSTYNDYYKLFHYYKEDYRETTNKPSQSSTVYNIVEWVQYRSK